MSPKEPPRRRVPGPARPRNAVGGQGRPRPAARRRPSPAPRARAPRNRPARPLRLSSPRPRLRLVGVALTLVMLVFVVRLLQVQAVDANAYAAKAKENRYLSYTISAERGEITDRSGIALATSVDAYDITADPSMFTPEFSKAPDAPRQAAALLAPILGADTAELTAKLSKEGRYTVLARRQTPQVWNQIRDLKSVFARKAAKDKAAGGPGANVLAGVFQEATTKRVYPNGGLAAGILGYVNAEGKGAGGLESQLDKELAGEDGKIKYAQSGGRRVPTAGTKEVPAVAGSDIELTIDRDIQWAAQQAITDQVKKSKADRGYVVVQNTRTGEVLAMANAPGFDPNDLSQADAASLGNAALQDAYEPGSTSKVMSMAAVLEEGVATPGTHVTVPNLLHRGDRLFKDDIDHPTWYLTLNGVLAKSSNIGTILATGELGRTQPQANKVLYSYLRKFGIGSPTGLGYPGETPASWPSPRAGRLRSSTRSRSARASRSTPCRPPPSTRRSPTAGCASHPRWYAAPRAPTATSRPPPLPNGAGWSARRPPRRSPRCWNRWSETMRAPERRPRSRATGWRARPVPPTGSTPYAAATTATPRPSRASHPPTTRRSPSTARSRTPPRAATSAVRSVDRSTNGSWSSR